MPTSLGPAEILVILVVALIVLGPKRLPEAGRQVGKAIAEVRRWTNEVTSEIKSVVDLEAPLKSTVTKPTVVSASSTAVETRPEPVPVAEVVSVQAVATVDGVAIEPAALGVEAPAEQPVPGPEAPPGDPAPS